MRSATRFGAYLGAAQKLRTALYDPIRNRIGEGYEVGRANNEAIIFAMAHHTYDGITLRVLCICLNLLLYRSGAPVWTI